MQLFCKNNFLTKPPASFQVSFAKAALYLAGGKRHHAFYLCIKILNSFYLRNSYCSGIYLLFHEQTKRSIL